MSRPIFEPTLERADAALGYDKNQLQRRPRAGRAIATLHIKLFSDEEEVTVGDGRFYEAIAEDMDALLLSNVELFVSTASSSGIVRVQIHNVTQATDMLSTRVQIDANELNSATAATAYVIDPAAAEVAWQDLIRIDIDDDGTGAEGLGIHLEFS